MAPEYQRANHLIGSKIDDSMVITSIDDDKFYGLNKVASLIWEILEHPVTKETIITRLLAQFEVDHNTCQKQVNDFLNEMLRTNVIEQVS